MQIKVSLSDNIHELATKQASDAHLPLATYLRTGITRYVLTQAGVDGALPEHQPRPPKHDEGLLLSLRALGQSAADLPPLDGSTPPFPAPSDPSWLTHMRTRRAYFDVLYRHLKWGHDRAVARILEWDAMYPEPFNPNG